MVDIDAGQLPLSEDPTRIRFWEEVAPHDDVPPPAYWMDDGDPVEGDFSIDTSAYTSREYHEREMKSLWPTTWQFACRANDIPNVGDYIEYEIAGLSVLVVRGESGQIRAFRNACRHRGVSLVEGQGSTDCFVCPFHGWTYALDGSLTFRPASWDFPDFEQASYGLVPVNTEVFSSLVWINLDEKAPSLRSYLGEKWYHDLSAIPYDRMWKSWHLGIVVNSNWKVMQEAFCETYHVATTHPEIIATSVDLQSKYDTFGLHWRSITGPQLDVGCIVGGAEFAEQERLEAGLGSRWDKMGQGKDGEVPQLPEGVKPRQYAAAEIRKKMLKNKGLDFSAVSDAELVDNPSYWVFPNMRMTHSPFSVLAYRFRPNGDDHLSSIYEVMNLMPMSESESLPKDAPLQMLKPGERLADYQDQIGLVGLLLDEDVSNSARVQKGLRVLNKRTVAAKRMEKNIVSFHRNMDAWIDTHSG
jgi:phenylpropionate dioxygenase-like ring-hydroxylating dioxygenase large terminal subunit